MKKIAPVGCIGCVKCQHYWLIKGDCTGAAKKCSDFKSYIKKNKKRNKIKNNGV